MLYLLSYAAIKKHLNQIEVLWAMRGSNPRQPGCKPGALPAELIARESERQDLNLRHSGPKPDALPTALRSVDVHYYIS